MNHTSLRRTCRPKPILRWTLVITAVIGIFFPLFVFSQYRSVHPDASIDYEWLAVFAIFFLPVPVGLRELAINRLTISQDGIEYQCTGVNISTSWNNVECIEMNQNRFVNLILRKPVSRNWILRSWLFRLLGYDRVIPLSPYVKDFGNSELIKDIAWYAPQLEFRIFHH